MVARINTGNSISKALNYNEKKVQHKQAECLHAHNFLMEVQEMNFYQKKMTFEKLTSLNDRARTNMVHISLNFDPSETLNKEKLVAVADSYMEKIGFKEQPYIIYQHHDTGHPHIHIVTTNIKSDGSRISMHNMGRNQSEYARKAIETEFDLVKAENRKHVISEALQPLNAQKLNPGKRPTKAAMSNVLRIVIPHYKYATLAELNAILSLYNMRADRCGEQTNTYKHQGLLYRVLDNNGNPTGTPIKASRFYMKPTLKNLQERFKENEKLKLPQAQRFRTKIDYILKTHLLINLPKLVSTLKKDGISLVIRQNKDGFIYGLTYVDHISKTVFNGSDLGKPYSAKTILERCNKSGMEQDPSGPAEKNKSQVHEMLQANVYVSSVAHFSQPPIPEHSNNIVDVLLQPGSVIEALPYSLKKTKRKKRRKRLKL